MFEVYLSPQSGYHTTHNVEIINRVCLAFMEQHNHVVIDENGNKHIRGYKDDNDDGDDRDGGGGDDRRNGWTRDKL